MSVQIDAGTTLDALLERPFFFNRPEVAARLGDQLLKDHMVVLLGPQGSGKGPLARTSLLPYLRQERSQHEWRMVTVRPSIDPLGNLARALTEPGVLMEQGGQEVNFDQDTRTMLSRDSNGIAKFYEQVVKQSGASFNLLLIVDQKQDFFRFQEFIDDGEDEVFLKSILSAGKADLPIYVVFISDNESLTHFSRYRGIPELINNYRFNISLPARGELEGMIRARINDDVIPEFLQNTLDAYEHLLVERKDKYALLKFSTFLRFTNNQWKAQDAVTRVEGERDEFFKQQLCERDLFYFMNEQLDQRYKSLISNPKTPDEWLRVVELIFQALVTNGTLNEPVRKPLRLRELHEWCKRGELAPSQDDLLEIINWFNGTDKEGRADRPYIIVVATKANQSVSGDSIVDLQHEVTAKTWLRLREWIAEEGMYANTFRVAHNAAYTYFNSLKETKAGPQIAQRSEQTWSFRVWISEIFGSMQRMLNRAEKVKQKEVAEQLYRGASLDSAVAWLESCSPNEAWARRYPLLTTNKIEPERIQLFEKIRGASIPEPHSDLAITEAFVRYSKYQDDIQRKRIRDKRRLQIITAIKQKRRAFLLAMVALIMMGVALFARHRANGARKNLELIGIVDVLSMNNILQHEPGEALTEIEQLQLDIAKDYSINSPEKVLHFLSDRGYLLMSEDDQDSILSIQSLLALDQTFDEIKVGNSLQYGQDFTEGTDLSPSTFRLLQLAEPFVNKPFNQHPHLFQAMDAQIQIFEARNESAQTLAYRDGRSLIDFICSNLAKDQESQYAHADRDGNVFISGRDQNDLPYVKTIVEQKDIRIAAMDYGLNGEELFIGTTQGDLHAYTGFEVKGGEISSSIVSRFSNGGIRQIVPFTEDKLLVHAQTPENSIYLLTRNNGNWSKQKLSGMRGIPTKIDDIFLNRENNLLAVTGRNYTLVYQVVERQGSTRLELNLQINHQETSINRVAMNSRDDVEGSWLVLGSEIGDIWYTRNLSDWLGTANRVGEVQLDDENVFTSLQGHYSTITSLVFNPGYPQFVSTSLDGNLFLWDMDKLDDPSQHVRLQNYGQGIWTSTYINKDEVIIAENIHTNIWKTSIGEQRKYLQRLLCLSKFCNHAN